MAIVIPADFAFESKRRILLFCMPNIALNLMLYWCEKFKFQDFIDPSTPELESIVINLRNRLFIVIPTKGNLQNRRWKKAFPMISVKAMQKCRYSIVHSHVSLSRFIFITIR